MCTALIKLPTSEPQERSSSRTKVVSKFVQCDVFDPALEAKIKKLAASRKGAMAGNNKLEDCAKPLTVGIFITTMFFHLFEWETQIQAACNLIRLSKPGTQIVGYQAGKVLGAESASPIIEMEGRRDGKTPESTPTAFFHDMDSWKRLWDVVEGRTSTK